jgi:hypothetical protein
MENNNVPTQQEIEASKKKMNKGKLQFFIGAVFALIAFGLFSNLNSAHSDRIGHGWYIGAGLVVAAVAAYFLIKAIAPAIVPPSKRGEL